MKAKTSVTLSQELLEAIDRLAGSKSSRSAIIERAVRSYLKEREREFIYAHDLELLNRYADQLNAESEDIFEYQADPWRPEME